MAERDIERYGDAPERWAGGSQLALHLLPALRTEYVDPATNAVDYEAILFVRSIDPALDLSSLTVIANDDYDAALAAARATWGMPADHHGRLLELGAREQVVREIPELLVVEGGVDL